jgi:hypothetical protein
MKNIKECIEIINAAASNHFRQIFAAETKNELISYHHSFGMWVRNHCHLWDEHGCDAIKEDFARLKANGYLFERTDGYITSDHPDDLSAVVVELYHDYLNKKFSLEMLALIKVE